MIDFFKKLNKWIRDFMLDDVDKPFDGPLPYHKEFGKKRNPVERIEKRFDVQKSQNRG
ncbi:hypothetical protein [Hyunsoonleella rubra]|uniref:Uncharacterized protein n=1 Tax=Hyunsoonleella rubra TaxID=1737062 RepID=A0ABW5TCR6_9FLAO